MILTLLCSNISWWSENNYQGLASVQKYKKLSFQKQFLCNLVLGNLIFTRFHRICYGFNFLKAITFLNQICIQILFKEYVVILSCHLNKKTIYLVTYGLYGLNIINKHLKKNILCILRQNIYALQIICLAKIALWKRRRVYFTLGKCCVKGCNRDKKFVICLFFLIALLG